MSPTMTEGGIAGWKKNEGESFAAGDVLLEIVSGDSLGSLAGGDRVGAPAGSDGETNACSEG